MLNIGEKEAIVMKVILFNLLNCTETFETEAIADLFVFKILVTSIF